MCYTSIVEECFVFLGSVFSNKYTHITLRKNFYPCGCFHPSKDFVNSVYLFDIKISQIGLSASTIASSFGKAISENKEIEDYRPEDISLSLLRMISYNIGQASLVVKLIDHHTDCII